MKNRYFYKIKGQEEEGEHDGGTGSSLFTPSRESAIRDFKESLVKRKIVPREGDVVDVRIEWVGD